METEVFIYLFYILIIDSRQKTKYEENIKTIYTQMVNYEFQKTHPFGLAEGRLGWKQKYANGNDVITHKKIIRNKRDNLEGGLGRFLTRITLENEREREQERERLLAEKKSKKNKNIKDKKNKYDTQRVIFPEKNTEIKKANKKRTYRSQEKNISYHIDGRITTLFDKTPLLYGKNKGKKIINNSIDYGKKKDTDLFSEEFLNDKKYNRIPGVTRKLIIPKVNQETEPYDPFFPCKKHYFCYQK